MKVYEVGDIWYVRDDKSLRGRRMNFKIYSSAKNSFSLLLECLNVSHIKQWWEPDVIWTKELIQEKYKDYMQRYKWHQGLKKPLHAYITSANNCPMGYIQFYNAYDFPREDHIVLEGLPKSLAALDFFIGDKEYLEKELLQKS